MALTSAQLAALADTHIAAADALLTKYLGSTEAGGGKDIDLHMAELRTRIALAAATRINPLT